MSIVWMDGFDGYGNGNGLHPFQAQAISPTEPNGDVSNVMFEKYTNPSNNFEGASGSLITEGGVNDNQGTVNTGKGQGRFDWIKLVRQGVRISQIEDRFVVNTSNADDDNTQTWYIGFGIFIPVGNSGARTNLIRLLDIDSNTHLTFNIDNGSRLYVLGPSSTVLGVSSLRFKKHRYYFVEIEAVVRESPNGSVKIVINGETTLDVSGIDTRFGGSGGTVTSMRFSSRFVSSSFGDHGEDLRSNFWTIDDLYVLDGSGSINNDFLGDSLVDTVFPVENGVTNTFEVFGAVSNFEAVDEIASLPDGGTISGGEVEPPPIPQSDQSATFEADYISSNTIGARDLYEMEDLSFGQDTVAGLEINNFVRQNPGDLQNRRMFNTLRTDTNIVDKGSATNVSTRYKYKGRIVEQNPSTSNFWNLNQVNSTQFGVEMASNG